VSDMAAMLPSSWDRWPNSSASISGSTIVDSMMGKMEAFAALTACIERRVASAQRDRYWGYRERAYDNRIRLHANPDFREHLLHDRPQAPLQR